MRVLTRIDRRRVLLSIILIVAAGVSAHADRVDDLIRSDMTARRIPGVSIAVVKSGRIVRAQAYGLANIALGVSAGADTVYEIASSTKPFTATAIMLLAEEGKLSLTDAIGSYVPHLPDPWKPVTIRQLLTRTSGIKDFSDLADTDSKRARDYTHAQIIRLVSAAPLEFRPGDKWSYSNTGHFLLVNQYGLGWFLGDIAGHRYAENPGVIPSGFTSEILRFPDDVLAVIVLTNRAQADFVAADAPRPWDIARRVAAFYIPALR